MMEAGASIRGLMRLAQQKLSPTSSSSLAETESEQNKENARACILQ